MDQIKSKCALCHAVFSDHLLIPLGLLHPDVVRSIQKNSRFTITSPFICQKDLIAYQGIPPATLLQDPNLHTENELLAMKNVFKNTKKSLTFGERLSDKLTSFGGSWTFIILFWIFLAVWVLVNIRIFVANSFDPYPYILLNLILSCIAAIQAPIILMSQNRQDAKDRIRAAQDYQVNLRAAIEIRHLHEKVDHFNKILWDTFAPLDEDGNRKEINEDLEVSRWDLRKE